MEVGAPGYANVWRVVEHVYTGPATLPWNGSGRRAMGCSACGAENRPEARFCNECGAAQAATCASCGQGNAPGSRYCDACGQPLTIPVRPDASTAGAPPA